MNTSRRLARVLALFAAVASHAAPALAQGFNNPVLSIEGVNYAAADEQQLIETLRTAAPAEKAIACKELAIHGTKDAVPELAKLLADEQLASWARIALEAIPDPAADEALLEAAKALQGRLLVGAINSIGVRRGAEAVEHLTDRLNDRDAEVASAAAVALGRIGNEAATKSLRQSLAGAVPAVRSAVAEGCILCAERLLAEGNADEAAKIYDEVRRADVPKPRILEATRGAILARQSEGIPLLIEQLKSADQDSFQIGLSTARELPGSEVADALAAELPDTAPERAALLLYALADRRDASLTPGVLEAATSGDKRVRMAAIDVMGRLGNGAHVPALLQIAADTDAEVAQAAKSALANLPGENVDAEIVARLSDADSSTLAVLVELVGQRGISATPALVKAADHSDTAIRRAALTALGATVGPKDLAVLVSRVVDPKNLHDVELTDRALQAAAIRMPDREATAAELAAALPRASTAAKASLLKTLGAMGGPKALETIAAAVKGGDAQLQDAATRVLGEWMTVDAGPVLLALAKDPANEKYQVRALRGYIRLARQFSMPDEQRARMCQNALDAASRVDEQKLALAVLERYPSVDALGVAASAIQEPALKADASRVALIIAQKLGEQGADVKQLLNKVGVDPGASGS